MSTEIWKDLQKTNLSYRDIFIESWQDEYKRMHKALYSNLSSMIYEFAFLEANYELKDLELCYDYITLGFLHRVVFEHLIIKMYKVFVDGTEGCTIYKFKNSVVNSSHVKEEFRDVVKAQIAKNSLEDKKYLKTKRELLEKNIRKLRNGYIAHMAYKPDENFEVDIIELKDLFKRGCHLFQLLSFGTSTFYEKREGDGYSFSAEFEMTKDLSEKFLRNTKLTSSYIEKITCCYADYCKESERRKLEENLTIINLQRA